MCRTFRLDEAKFLLRFAHSCKQKIFKRSLYIKTKNQAKYREMIINVFYFAALVAK